MTLTLELTPEQERRLAEARKKGIPVESLLLAVIEHLTPREEMADTLTQLRALEAQWAEEDAKLSPEEIAKENAEWEAFIAEHPLKELRLREPKL
ncbi:MAG TPA: hypothetical protein VFB21_22760 [Chthonomonadaceae bacterium]|nr:hypothetical protein [Chthonomonadaceae bacterium]